MISVLLALVLVIGLILALAWLLRRLPGTGMRTGEGLRIITGVSLGSKERAVVVEIDSKQLLLGVTPGSVSLLYTLEHPLPEPAPTRLPEFARLLKRRT